MPVMYPLFHRSLRHNIGRPSAEPLEGHLFTSQPRMDAILMEHTSITRYRILVRDRTARDTGN